MAIGSTARSNGPRFAQADMNRNQPSKGDNQMGTASKMIKTAAQVSNNGTTLQMNLNGLAPAVPNQTLMMIRFRR